MARRYTVQPKDWPVPELSQENKEKALRQAVWDGQVADVEHRIKLGARIMAGDREHGWQPIHIAAIENKQESAELLFTKGARVEAEDNRRAQPIHLAAAAGTHEMLELLLDYGASVDARDMKGLTPLHIAAYMGHLRCVEVLVVEDAKTVHVMDRNGATPFHWAVMGGHEKVGARLLRAGAKGASARSPWNEGLPVDLWAQNAGMCWYEGVKEWQMTRQWEPFDSPVFQEERKAR